MADPFPPDTIDDAAKETSKKDIAPAPAPAPPPLDDEALKLLGKVVFRDERWDRALQHLSKDSGWGHGKAVSLLKKGATAYGFWDLSDDSLHGLANQLLDGTDASEPSPGFQEWLLEQKDKSMAPAGSEPAMLGVPSVISSHTGGQGSQGARQLSNPARQTSNPARQTSNPSVNTVSLSRFGKDSPSRKLEHQHNDSRMSSIRFGACHLPADLKIGRKRQLAGMPDWKGHLQLNQGYLRVVKLTFHTVVLVISAAYAFDVVTNKYPDAVDLFSWPIFFARLGGMACALWTAILFLSMSRGLLSLLASFLPRMGRNFWFTFLDSHKDIHIMSGQALMVYATIHVLGHSIGTVPGMLQKSVKELNALLGCSQDDPPYLVDLGLDFLYWPDCPLTDSNKPKNFTEALFLTMPGLTGVLLVLVLAIVGYTSSGKQRAKNFELFWYVHNAMLWAWPVLLFFHGSQGWIGVGIPLVLLIVTIPIIAYSTSRVRRTIRYLFAGRCVKIMRATVRPGRNGSVAGAVTELEILPPPRLLWKFRPGTYAFICMPEYARFQWHPFTITSGKDDETVNFIISAVGDWTQELARRCLAAAQGDGKLPKVALDGPYVAPTMSAMEKKVLVAVGAGVGITPFISLLSTFIAQLPTEQGKDAKLVEGHFYWMTRNPTEFIFGWRLLHQWLEDQLLQSRIFIHLYTTAKDPTKDPAAFLFREAVKKQSAVDRKRFQEFLPEWQAASATCIPGPQFPWCWAEGQEADLIWVKCPNWDSDVSTGFLRAKDEVYMPRCCSEALMIQATMSLHMQRMFPVMFGRPNFLHDIASIGLAHPDANIHVYICGNDAIVKDLQLVCQKCTAMAKERHEKEGAPKQRYMVHFERFG